MLAVSDKDTMKQKRHKLYSVTCNIFTWKIKTLQNLKKKILPETAVDYEENRNQEGRHLTGIHKGICPAIRKKKAGLSLWVSIC